MKVKFGPSGNCEMFYSEGNKKTLDAPKWLTSKGLFAYEYSFGRGYTMSQQTALLIGEEAKKQNLEISVHAPYYINFANPSLESGEKSISYVISGLRFLKWLGGKKLVIHLGSCVSQDRQVALDFIKTRLVELAKIIENDDDFKGLQLCFETMGKFKQIGTYEEIIDFCKLSEQFYPTFDFGHINALLSGKLKTKEDYLNILRYSINQIGYEKMDKCHIHFSKIQFGASGGELRHLNFDDEIYGPEFLPLAQALIELNLHPTIICESMSHMTQDALTMKNIYCNELNH